MQLDNIPANTEFSFDEWASLYENDKRAFEARRQMVLAMEIAKATNITPETRANVNSLINSLEGKSDQERFELSMRWMVNSAEQLQLQLQSLALLLTTEKSISAAA